MLSVILPHRDNPASEMKSRREVCRRRPQHQCRKQAPRTASRLNERLEDGRRVQTLLECFFHELSKCRTSRASSLSNPDVMRNAGWSTSTTTAIISVANKHCDFEQAFISLDNLKKLRPSAVYSDFMFDIVCESARAPKVLFSGHCFFKHLPSPSPWVPLAVRTGFLQTHAGGYVVGRSILAVDLRHFAERKRFHQR